MLDDFFAAPTQTLYHYTSVAGLLGIVDSERILASHAYYLNDANEILQAAKVLRGILLHPLHGYEADDEPFLAEFAEWLQTFKSIPYHVFVFSLSERESLLSQWRSYTPHGKGVSVGFPASVLCELLKIPGVRIAKCLYTKQQHTELARALIDTIVERFRDCRDTLDVTRRPPTQKFFPFLEAARGEILQALALIKHGSFQEECEWRVISPYYPVYTVPEIKFREGSCFLLPYVEMPLTRKPVSPTQFLQGQILGEWLFERVTLGPTQELKLSLAALSTFLSNKRASPSVSHSGIPYRKW